MYWRQSKNATIFGVNLRIYLYFLRLARAYVIAQPK